MMIWLGIPLGQWPPPPLTSKVCTGQVAHIYWMIPIPDHPGPSTMMAWMPKYMRGDV